MSREQPEAQKFDKNAKKTKSVLEKRKKMVYNVEKLTFSERRTLMATVYCSRCVYLFQRGGVWYCGCTTSDLYDKAVDPNWGKCCNYYKER